MGDSYKSEHVKSALHKVLIEKMNAKENGVGSHYANGDEVGHDAITPKNEKSFVAPDHKSGSGDKAGDLPTPKGSKDALAKKVAPKTHKNDGFTSEAMSATQMLKDNGTQISPLQKRALEYHKANK